MGMCQRGMRQTLSSHDPSEHRTHGMQRMKYLAGASQYASANANVRAYRAGMAWQAGRMAWAEHMSNHFSFFYVKCAMN